MRLRMAKTGTGEERRNMVFRVQGNEAGTYREIGVYSVLNLARSQIEYIN